MPIMTMTNTAEDKIKEEWAAMTFEEQNNWNHIKKQMEVEVEV